MIRRPPRSTQGVSSAASDVYKRQYQRRVHGYSEGFATRLEKGGFTHEEIASLAVIDTFGLLETKEGNFNQCHFTNMYYKNLIKLGKAGEGIMLPQDQFLLADSNPFKESVKKFAEDRKYFKKVFVSAYAKLGKLGYSEDELYSAEEFLNTHEIRNP
eukprot:TRINITY_DN19199_c0_g1_i4.p1 TRINITY_DN19199_c0_g1~~TRINITY_DN19199_c0_g1_i4.p1  ORF type:complete len:157 (+),score=50.24 TRINITY_DN19199_c0_g1_i4:119-589(+)